ncbi:MAG TPA: VRR-NUC domain-containing protein [Oxalicibacterium sp.]|uniref:VRR-NUC domain-containing protein n=1 Tax=Oxalicibacterium sp. TaxID=2766525 RepID=UPI002D017929|nr:VRR-NUC domain-containing protein [Oxalicibacterium sp.]HWU97531.1 VRR-NUC domain-containing protein [Oxalicibacterium sp.]
MAVTLPNPFYYLENFQRVLDWLGERYIDLLSEEERCFIVRFPTLPQTSRALLVRMAMRKGEHFRSGKLQYAEIGCPHQAIQALLTAGWVEDDPPLTIEHLFALLKKTEIATVFGLTAASRLASKADLLETLRHEFTDARPLAAWHASLHEAGERIYRIAITSLCERMRLMFFGNLHQTWSEFVLSDLGIYRYEQVEFQPSSRGFQSRRDVDDYLHLHRCRERFDQGEYLDDILPDLPVEPHVNPWLETRRNKLLFRIAQEYERCKELQSALAIYQRCTCPGSRLRAIRVLERLEHHTCAFALAITADEMPESEAERQALLRILPRLRRKLGQLKLPVVKPQAAERIDLMLPFPAIPVSVEIAAADHLTRNDAPVVYVENTLINSLFGLLCWPAIFAAVPGAFFHPFHHGPVDLLSPDFHQRRAVQFTACLSQLNDDRYRQTIVANFHAKYGTLSPFVYWNAIDEELLNIALDCLPPDHLKKWFDRILRDISANRSGFPDLIQFYPQEKRYRMIEVKGPGDRLQDNQLRWMEYFVGHGMPVAVCHVQWMEQVMDDVA